MNFRRGMKSKCYLTYEKRFVINADKENINSCFQW